MSRVLFSLLITALNAVLWSPDSSALTFRCADVHQEDYPTVQAVKYMSQLLSERSGSDLTIEVFHSQQLGDEKASIEQCRAGGLDMTRVNLAPLIDDVPEAGVPSLPYIFRSEEHMHKVLDGPIGQEMLDAMERIGLVGLAYYDSGARSFYNTKKPIRSIDDFKGLRIRVQQTELFKALVLVLGGVPVPMPYGEVLDTLRSGVIDGAENNLPSYHSSGHYKVAQYYTLDTHSMNPEVLVFSKKVWESLSEENRQLIRQAAKDSVPHMRKFWQERETQTRKALEETGVEVVKNVDKEPFKRATKPIYDRFMTSDKLKDMVRRIEATQ